MFQSGRIDTHSHLLPGIDDGCPSYHDSLACGRMLVAAGYSHAFCTPHVWPSLPHNDVNSIVAGTGRLQRMLDEAGVPLRVLPGGEINLVWSWPTLADVAFDQIPTYGMLGQYVLFDFWAERMPECVDCLTEAVAHLQSLGPRVVLAHPERIKALQHDPATIEFLHNRGVLLQMNTWCLTDPPDSPAYQLAERLLTSGMYFCFGTDCHNAASMPNRIKGIEIATALVGKEAVDALTIENPRRFMGEGAPHPGTRDAADSAVVHA